MSKQERLNKKAINTLKDAIKGGLITLRDWRDNWEDHKKKSIVPSKMEQLHLQSIVPSKMEQLHLQSIAPSKMVQLPDPSMINGTKKVRFLTVQQDNESNKTSSGRFQLHDPSMIRIQLPIPFILD